MDSTVEQSVVGGQNGVVAENPHGYEFWQWHSVESTSVNLVQLVEDFIFSFHPGAFAPGGQHVMLKFQQILLRIRQHVDCHDR